MPFRLPFLILCLTLGLWHCAPSACAQDVRWQRTGFGATRRQGDNAADKLGRTDWPRVADGGPGTQVHVTFDLRNADVVLITGNGFGQQALLGEARRIAPRIGRPRADYILYTSPKTVATDIELNKYLVRPDARHTQSDLDLSALAAALNTSSLPRPVVLYIRADDADVARVTAPGTARKLGESTFFGLSEVPPGSRLHFAAAVPWYAALIGFGLGGILLFALVSLMLAPWRIAKKRAERAGLPQPAVPPAPEEVQRRYDRQRPLAVVTSLLPLSFILLSLLGNPHRFLTAALYSLPFDPNSQTMLPFPLVMFGLIGSSALVCAVVQRRRVRLAGIPLPASVADPDAPPAWTQRWFLGVMGVMLVPMLLLPVLLFSGVLTHLPWLRFLPFVFLGLMSVALIVGGWLSARAVRTTLQPGDPWYALVHEVAVQAGVPVRHIVRLQSPVVNAYASLFGTVGLTAGLLRKMEPDEVRAVVAHEIGHLRGGHVRRGFVIGLVVTAAFWALWWSGLYALRSHLPDFAYNMLSGPMVGVFLFPLLMSLLLGRGRRRREAEADRFAVEATGDPALVIATLTKLHTLNASPHRLKPSDELLSSHPSLCNRVEAIRRNSPSG